MYSVMLLKYKILEITDLVHYSKICGTSGVITCTTITMKIHDSMATLKLSWVSFKPENYHLIPNVT